MYKFAIVRNEKDWKRERGGWQRERKREISRNELEEDRENKM